MAIKRQGSKQIDLPEVTTAQRSTEKGRIQFNTTLGLAEYYDGTQWKAIDSPPIISSVSPAAPNGSGITVTITGDNFSTTGTTTVHFIDGAATSLAGTSVNVVSVTSITVVTPTLVGTNAPYDVKVTNPSGLTATGGNLISVGATPVFTTAAGSIGSIYETQTDFSGLSTLAATDADGDTITYAISSGSLPSGVSMSTSTAALSGTAPAVGSDTVSTFTITATDTKSNVATRQFTMIVANIVEGQQAYTATGNHTFTVPTGVTSVAVVCIGGGGGNYLGNSGQAGGGGALAYRNAITVVGGQTASVTVGVGGGTGVDGGFSSFTYDGTATTAGGGAKANTTTAGGAGGTISGTATGFAGGEGGTDPTNYGGPGGGGAGGYSGAGGAGADPVGATTATHGTAGTGGAGGGGGKGGSSEMGGGGGGGTGILGEGSSGEGGTGQPTNTTHGGGGEGGSGGADGGADNVAGGGTGGLYGGGHGGSQSSAGGGEAADGAVRIIWGLSRSFPSTNTADV